MNISFENELKLPAVAAPMFLISGPQLVIECCKNGIVGTFPAHALLLRVGISADSSSRS